MGCSAQGMDSAELGDESVDVVDQAIGEAACGTNAPNEVLTFLGSQIVRSKSPPYGSASCRNAHIYGLRVPGGTHTASANVSFSDSVTVAQCPNARVTAVYYDNGQSPPKRVSKTATGIVSGGTCFAPVVRFNRTEIGSTSASQAQFAVQATLNSTTLKRVSIVINPP
jgi:hypothetical protein